jgi:hypothetical protein
MNIKEAIRIIHKEKLQDYNMNELGIIKKMKLC